MNRIVVSLTAIAAALVVASCSRGPEFSVEGTVGVLVEVALKQVFSHLEAVGKPLLFNGGRGLLKSRLGVVEDRAKLSAGIHLRGVEGGGSVLGGFFVVRV